MRVWSVDMGEDAARDGYKGMSLERWCRVIRTAHGMDPESAAAALSEFYGFELKLKDQPDESYRELRTQRLEKLERRRALR